jgi:hypothetical protein
MKSLRALRRLAQCTANLQPGREPYDSAFAETHPRYRGNNVIWFVRVQTRPSLICRLGAARYVRILCRFLRRSRCPLLLLIRRGIQYATR